MLNFNTIFTFDDSVYTIMVYGAMLLVIAAIAYGINFLVKRTK